MDNVSIIIPAIKKNVAFPDDLVKKMNGVQLVQIAIDKAKKLLDSRSIYVITDSQEITLISEKNQVNNYYNKELKLERSNLLRELKFFITRISKKFEYTIILWPYAPTIQADDIMKAYNEFIRGNHSILVTVKEEQRRVFSKKRDILDLMIDSETENYYAEAKAFLIMKTDIIRNGSQGINIHGYLLNSNHIEIKNYHDWWLCQKLLLRKLIVFRVIGNETLGMGHIHRSLTLAREIFNHEVLFVCDENSELAVNKIAGYDYPIEVWNSSEIEDKIIALRPDLIIHDILDTDAHYIQKLKAQGIRVINFEDLGSGAHCADLTINALYKEHLIKGKTIRWGFGYFFLRDEFSLVRPNDFKERVEQILITFGGADNNNLTFKTLNSIISFCSKMSIKIHIVSGEGYIFKDELSSYLKQLNCSGIEFTYATGVISKIMENVQVAITSNGRTVYELAHMNIPSIVISHHERESTHYFSHEANGFLNLGVFCEEHTEELIAQALERMCDDGPCRKMLFERMRNFDFLRNKKRITALISRLLETEL